MKKGSSAQEEQGTMRSLGPEGASDQNALGKQGSSAQEEQGKMRSQGTEGSCDQKEIVKKDIEPRRSKEQ